MTVHEVPELYAQTVGAMDSRMRQSSAGPGGDPRRAAEILVQVAKRTDIPYHLPLGVNSAEGAIAQDRALMKSDEKWRAVSRSADFAEDYPVPFPAE